MPASVDLAFLAVLLIGILALVFSWIAVPPSRPKVDPDQLELALHRIEEEVRRARRLARSRG